MMVSDKEYIVRCACTCTGCMGHPFERWECDLSLSWQRKIEGVHHICLVVIRCWNPWYTKMCGILWQIEIQSDLWDGGHLLALVGNCMEEALWNLGCGKTIHIEAKVQQYNHLVNDELLKGCQ